MAVPASNLATIRLEYGDVAETIFDDAEILIIWNKMSGASSDYERERATIGYMFLITRNNAIKLRKYTQGETTDDQEAIFKHLQQVLAEYQPSIDGALGTKTEIARSTIRPRSHQTRQYPVDDPRYQQKQNRILKDSSE